MPAKPTPNLPNSLAVCGALVAMATVKFAALPPASARVAGVKEQLAFAGSPLQLSEIVPE